MKIAYMSDLHLDTYFDNQELLDEFKLIEADVLVMSGDIAEFNNYFSLMGFFDGLSEIFKNVILIAGNHEYYGKDLTLDTLDFHTNYLPKNFTFLNNESIKIDNVNFYGGTLWCDVDSISNNDKPIIIQLINDFKLIKNNGLNLSLESLREYYEEFLKGMYQNITDKTDDSKLVVLSHFAPSMLSVTPRFKGSRANQYFCNSLDDTIAASNIDVWIHGHVHSNHDYMINKTRVLCNPRGYPSENSNISIKVIEV